VHTEAAVTEALRRVLVSVTGIVVAHRASTVLLADQVALLEHGTVTQVGTHSQLLETVPAYRYLLAADDSLDDLEVERAELEHRYCEEHAVEDACAAREFASMEGDRR
jgi:ATP-binding cassette, subfamily B, bacterial